MAEILSDAGGTGGAAIRWRTLSEFPDIAAPAEDADSFLGNAAAKAHAYALASGLWTIADDSGLQVDALNGSPGVYSSRYAGLKGDDRANNRKLIAELRDVPPARRTARFRCAAVLSDGHRVLASAEGTVEGVIIDEARGNNGFGYDPHFYVPQLGLTTAEMAADQKHAISHRGQALRRLRAQILDLLRE